MKSFDPLTNTYTQNRYFWFYNIVEDIKRLQNFFDRENVDKIIIKTANTFFATAKAGKTSDAVNYVKNLIGTAELPALVNFSDVLFHKINIGHKNGRILPKKLHLELIRLQLEDNVNRFREECYMVAKRLPENMMAKDVDLNDPKATMKTIIKERNIMGYTVDKLVKSLENSEQKERENDYIRERLVELFEMEEQRERLIEAEELISLKDFPPFNEDDPFINRD